MNDHVLAWRRAFLLAWSVLLVAKLAIAARLPLFVDEAFYWQEGQHLAWAYSDLPGLTAWLTRLGVTLGGHHVLAVRMPFLLLGALLPWLVAKIAARWFGESAGWQAGLLTTLMPLSATLGLLALPDVPMAIATALCLDAGARLLGRVSAGSALELALGLAMGALSHYRFAGVIVVGFLALLMLRQGRRVLRDPRVIVALAIGAVAWLPLAGWNVENADAGLRFQLLDRHPWTFHADGLMFVLIQASMVTPLLFALLVQTFATALRGGESDAQWRYFGLLGGISTLGLFALGFFADNERVSFHWTLPGYLALMAAAPVVLARWRPSWRRLTWAMLVAGTLAMLGWYAAVSTPDLRARMAMQKQYPSNFAGWEDVAAAVREELAKLPADTELVADNFKLGAELGFALGRGDIRVLDHPMNVKHGRAPQLRLWGLTRDIPAPGDERPALLVIGSSEVRYKDLLAHYHALCDALGPLVPRRIVNVDHGAQRFVLVKLSPGGRGDCSAPAMAYVDAPAIGARVARRFTVTGWAFREGTGLDAIEILLDGHPIARAEYGLDSSGTLRFWRPRHEPGGNALGFRAEVDAGGLPAGRHWLGLRLHGRDGVVEDWAEQPLSIGD
ncbi:glycosyltransferase family 39 protein [Lysobacter pythonis]|uniref:Glycosyltransferase family 39 protein n=1 Tax=Solilutibacter pythonis TaxID=2483112 RepID=A0A3M2HU05_9GAMM|nr:glycosyltransferase family 39 protein [Lysobacter pythonis]RMH90889.1 glycosyltransferase family 39 protein [Lysobacter pythonis]